MIIAIVLAAGESTRMIDSSSKRKLKQLLPFGKTTVLESVLQTLLYSKVDKIVVVLGHEKDIIKKVIQKYNVETVFNTNYKQGMLSSIQCGIKYARQVINKSIGQENAQPSGIMICLGDQPLVRSSIIDKLVLKFQKSKQGILIPTYRKRRGHPILIHTTYCEEILKISVEKGLRELMLNHSQDVLEIPVSSSAILKDIDTPKEYDIAVRLLKKKMRKE